MGDARMSLRRRSFACPQIGPSPGGSSARFQGNSPTAMANQEAAGIITQAGVSASAGDQRVFSRGSNSTTALGAGRPGASPLKLFLHGLGVAEGNEDGTLARRYGRVQPLMAFRGGRTQERFARLGLASFPRFAKTGRPARPQSNKRPARALVRRKEGERKEEGEARERGRRIDSGLFSHHVEFFCCCGLGLGGHGAGMVGWREDRGRLLVATDGPGCVFDAGRRFLRSLEKAQAEGGARRERARLETPRARGLYSPVYDAQASSPRPRGRRHVEASAGFFARTRSGPSAEFARKNTGGVAPPRRDLIRMLVRDDGRPPRWLPWPSRERELLLRKGRRD